ncbi:hypothetical protein BaRGS_00003037 [Batillaria attramentaria]|uniref:Cytoplasmic tRNA 2-thiolation protein 2 n=1 Tax=Batillaria attramentaria TaxID=370345 RepID=A0ABD0M206_9CAEN
MCSIQDGELEDIISKQSVTAGRECVKCQGTAVLVTRINDAFCKSCFQVYVVHKFRASIGKSKLIRDGEHVLVAFSGGASSSALLHLIEEGRSPRAHRKLRFTATVIYVDETGILKWSAAEREEKELNLEKSDFSDMSDVSPICWDVTSGTGESEFQARTASTERLQQLFAALPSDSAREEFLRVAKTRLLLAVARQRGFDKILVGDCSTRLSVRILTDMAQGRGSQVALDTSIGDKRYGDVMVIRPLRDLNSKEVALYNVLNQVETVFIPALTTKTAAGSSIDRLTETFITGLQADFPSTVPNIVRTSEKLGQAELNTSVGCCAFCQSPLDTDVGEASALHAVQVSEHLSQTAGAGQVSATAGGGACSGSGGDGDCQQGHIHHRQVMHSQIAEFLLEKNVDT